MYSGDMVFIIPYFSHCFLLVAVFRFVFPIGSLLAYNGVYSNRGFGDVICSASCCDGIVVPKGSE
jgi:hypothetical protein